MKTIKPTPLVALLALCAPAVALAQATSEWDRNVERMDYLTNPPERGDNNFFTTVVAQTGNVALLYPAKTSLRELMTSVSTLPASISVTNSRSDCV